MSNDLIRRQLMESANPEDPLPNGDPRYVDCAKERGTERLFAELADGIRLAPQPVCKLLTGHRGCGKTTELFRVQSNLENGDRKFYTVYFRAEDFVALRDAGAPDLLLSIAAAVWQDVKERTHHVLESGLFKRLLDGVGDLIGAVKVESVEIQYSIAKLKSTFTKNVTNRKLVRERLAADTPSLVDAVNEVLSQAREALKGDYAGIVVIADNFDRMPSIKLPNSPLTNQEVVFVEAWDLIQSLECHTILTIPPPICWVPAVARLNPLRIPMVPLENRDGSPNVAGIAKLRQILEKRVDYHRNDFRSVFDSGTTADRLLQLSGGRERTLLALFCECVQTGYPVTAGILESVFRDRRDTMQNALQGKPQHWESLRRVRDTRQRAEDPELIENFYVLDYRDAAGYWYGVNPLVAGCPELKPEPK